MAEFPASLLILNGKSTDNLPLREAIMLLREEGMTIHVRVTWEKGDAARFVEEARKLGVATVIAGNAIAIDMAQVNKQTCFINMATGGFGTRITTETPEKLKAALGGVSYIIHGLMRMDTLQPDRCEIRGENFHWQGDALVIGIGNGRQAGGGQQLCPNALINDGLLQLRIFTGDEILPALVSTLKSDEDNPNIIEGASSWFDIQAPHEITFNLDGEPLSGQNFHIEILPAALRCRLPPDCPLLR
ncbi:lipid kinase YegS [Shigella flexneri]|nr:lipid kinase YegS [Shigella flexneri]